MIGLGVRTNKLRAESGGGGNVAPSNVTAPVISGSTSLGSVLSTNNGTWSGTPATFSYTYQWKRNGSPIGGATASTYTTVVADSTANITCDVTADNGVAPTATAGSNTLTMANYTPANTVPPSVTGTAVVGQTLSTTNGTWTNSPSTFSYQWYRGATLISGATSSTYTLVQADAGNTSNIKCVVTASNGLSASADSNTVAQVLDADANAFFTAMALTDATIIAAENNFFIQRKNISALSNAIASYHMVTDKSLNADRLNQFKYNAYNSLVKTLSYSGTVTANTTGIQGNGVNGYANTSINSSIDFSTTDFSIVIISRTTSAIGGVELGCVDSGANGLNLALKWSDNNTFNAAFGTNINSGNVVSGTTAIFIYKRSGNTVTLKRNNVTVFSRTETGTTKVNNNIFILARNFNGSPQFYSSREYSFFEFINGALTTQQETDLYNALVTRETALGR